MSQRDEHKAMARGLRLAGQQRGVQLSHGECLDIVARAAGLKNWNVLCAKLDPQEGAAVAEQCDFCGLPPAEGRRLFWGPTNTICLRCAEFYVEAAEHRDVVERLGEEGAAEAFLSRKSDDELERYVRIANRRINEKTTAINQMNALLEGRSDEEMDLQPGVETTRWAWLAARTRGEVAALRDAQVDELALSRAAYDLATATLETRCGR